MPRDRSYSPATFALLERLAVAPEGMTAAELQADLGLDGRPSSRLNVLMRDKLVHVDTHDQRWTILHRGFDVATSDWSDERIVEALRLWPKCRCAVCREALDAVA